MIPVSRLHATLDAGYTAAYDLAGDIKALIPPDGGVYSGEEVERLRIALTWVPESYRAAALALLDSAGKEKTCAL